MFYVSGIKEIYEILSWVVSKYDQNNFIISSDFILKKVVKMFIQKYACNGLTTKYTT